MPVLVAPDAFGGELRAPVVAAAVGRGLERAGGAPPDLCPVAGGGRGTIEALLPALGGETGDGFALVEDGATAIVELGEAAVTGERLAAHAVVVGERRLDRSTLRGRVAGEIATRARQAGVPCHAVVGASAIDRFDARILDLQAIVEATTIAELEAAGEALTAYL